MCVSHFQQYRKTEYGDRKRIFNFYVPSSVLCCLSSENTMKPAIHPTYHPKAAIRCTSCGMTYEVGSTLSSADVEICANCHPFFSGKGTYIDTARRIDKFRKRQALAGKKHD